MTEGGKLYDIIETKYNDGEKIKTKLPFQGTLEEAQQGALKKARENIGVQYSVFPREGFIADFQAYFRTTIKCPRCGEIIPIE